jgi:hypothetical protein
MTSPDFCCVPHPSSFFTRVIKPSQNHAVGTKNSVNKTHHQVAFGQVKKGAVISNGIAAESTIVIQRLSANLLQPRTNASQVEISGLNPQLLMQVGTIMEVKSRKYGFWLYG